MEYLFNPKFHFCEHVDELVSSPTFLPSIPPERPNFFRSFPLKFSQPLEFQMFPHTPRHLYRLKTDKQLYEKFPVPAVGPRPRICPVRELQCHKRQIRLFHFLGGHRALFGLPNIPFS